MNLVHLATASDQVTAEIWLSILRDEGIAAMINPADAVSFLGVSGMGCRIQVAQDDLERAREVLGPDIPTESP